MIVVIYLTPEPPRPPQHPPRPSHAETAGEWLTESRSRVETTPQRTPGARPVGRTPVVRRTKTFAHPADHVATRAPRPEGRMVIGSEVGGYYYPRLLSHDL